MRARQGLAGVIISAVGLIVAPAQSQDWQAQQQALAQIIKTANEICQSAPLEETSRGIDLKGDANAKLGGLVGKLADWESPAPVNIKRIARWEFYKKT